MEQKKSRFAQQVIKYEENRFGAMTFMMIFQSCLGSVAAMSALYYNNYVLLSICAALTMGANVAFISQGPARWCLLSFYASVIINTAIIAWNLVL